MHIFKHLKLPSFIFIRHCSVTAFLVLFSLNSSVYSQDQNLADKESHFDRKKIKVDTIDMLTNQKSSSIYEFSFQDNILFRDGKVLSIKNKYHLKNNIHLQNSKVVADIKFGDDFIDLNKAAPKVSHLLHNHGISAKNLSTHKYQQDQDNNGYAANKFDTSKIRDIRYYVVLPEDFALEISEQDLVSEVLRITFNSNQFLQEIGFRLVPAGIKIYRGSSRFTQAIQNRDPYTMLSRGVDEKAFIGSPESGDLLVVMSKTFFSRAAGLAYLSTSCENPNYSVVFASVGATKSNYEVALATVLAHEVGHFLGMNHDDNFYSKGFSLMSARQVAMPFGFSDKSKDEQALYSSQEKSGGSCLVPPANFIEDTDNDGVLDIQELATGTNPYDSGSYYMPLTGTSFLQWNTNLNQETIGEFLNVNDFNIELQIYFRDMNGKVINTLLLPLSAGGQQDVLFKNFIGQYKNSYGYVEIFSKDKYVAKGTNYSFLKNFNKFDFVTQQDAFQSINSSHLFFPVNFNIPNTIPNGDRVSHWLSIVNLGTKNDAYRVSFYAPNGTIRHEVTLGVASKSRFDFEIKREDLLDEAGTIKVEKISGGNSNSFNAFLNRYYISKSGKVRSGILIEGSMPSGVLKNLVHTNSNTMVSQGSTLIDGWLELHNSLLISNIITVKAFSDNSELFYERSYELPPYGQIHVQLPNFRKEYLLTVESDKKDGLGVLALRYLNNKDLIVNEQLRFLEESMVTKNINMNTFLKSSNNLVISNSSQSKGTVSCSANFLNSTVNSTISLGSELYKVVSLSEMFPSITQNQYVNISCRAYNSNLSPIMSSMRVDRVVEQDKTLQVISR